METTRHCDGQMSKLIGFAAMTACIDAAYTDISAVLRIEQ